MTTILRYEEYDEGLHKAMRQPFPPEYIEWKPQATPGSQSQSDEGWGLAVPYVDPRWYLERLDTLVGPWGWASEIHPINTNGDKLIVSLTVLGVTKMNVGEKDSGDKNVFSSADAQAIKRACVEFGLGRYLYFFIPQTWVKMEKKGKSWVFVAAARTALRQIAEAGTKDYMDYLAGGKTPSTETPQAPAQPAPASASQSAPVAKQQPQQQPSGALEATPDLIPELNYEINAGGKAAEYTGITSGKIRLYHLVQAGDDGMGYLGWMASKWNDEDGKAAAAKVVEWRENGGQLPDEELDQGSPSEKPQESPRIVVNPMEGIDPSTIKSMPELCTALGVNDFSFVWEKLTKDGVWSKLPPPGDTAAWVKAYDHLVSEGDAQEAPF